ncbi:hypothetical protein TRVA0_002S04984 [Trichomonascus vanleenenianus]|uniref:palmitoyl-protein thioesterase family protein n=1 Tax=Trichomonascus vanleenenianus TaxID=2268995 RepID=UPI003ECA2D9F
MERVGEIIKDVYPGIHVHSVYLDSDSGADQRKSIFGKVDDRLEFVCAQLANNSMLADGFDAIGFSQGGLFLRAYAERCNSPRLHKLITFGSPHNGIADLPTCARNDFLCRQRNRLMRSQIWSDYVQNNVITAQYFRDPEDIESYLEKSQFLADVNNERSLKNETYREQLSTLERLVLIAFSDDETVVPKQSAWFQEVNRTTGEITPLEQREIYSEDWIGLKRLVDEHLIDYMMVNGVHMEIHDKYIKHIAKKYLGTTERRFIVQGTYTGATD